MEINVEKPDFDYRPFSEIPSKTVFLFPSNLFSEKGVWVKIDDGGIDNRAVNLATGEIEKFTGTEKILVANATISIEPVVKIKKEEAP